MFGQKNPTNHRTSRMTRVTAERDGDRRAGKAATRDRQGGALVTEFLEEEGTVALERIARSFGLSKAQIAASIGVSPETLQSTRRARAPKTQARLREMLEIVGRLADWAGGRHQAMAWYRAEPIPAFGGRTAESLVKEGKAASVRDYLDHVAVGGFA
jgi:hypothetical protein